MDFRQDTQAPAAGKTPKIDWKILGGFIVVVIFVAYILIRFFVFVSGTSYDAYEKVLSAYYAAAARHDTNAVKALVTPDFADEMPSLPLAPGRYELYSYSSEKTERGPKPDAGTNAAAKPEKALKILYSVTTIENSRRVSYLMESVFVTEGSQPKLTMIRKLSEGKNITK